MTDTLKIVERLRFARDDLYDEAADTIEALVETLDDAKEGLAELVDIFDVGTECDGLESAVPCSAPCREVGCIRGKIKLSIDVLAKARSKGTTADKAASALLEALSAAGMPVMEWRDIGSAPRDGSYFLAHCWHPVWAEWAPHPVVIRWGGLLFKKFRKWPWAFPPTHWMPLPEPPK